MTNPTLKVVGLIALVGVAIYATRTFASINGETSYEGDSFAPGEYYPDFTYNEPTPTPTPSETADVDPWWNWNDDSIPQYAETDMSADENLTAFLAVIRTGEGTSGANGYRTLYGGSLFTDMADHPSNLGWPGVVLPDNYCAGAGLPKGCKTTAAGAYQFLSSTWNEAKRALNLPDFSPESQDAAAIWLIQRRGAYDDVIRGNFDAALQKVAREWASLPGSPYGQPTLSLTRAQKVFTDNGGVIA